MKPLMIGNLKKDFFGSMFRLEYLPPIIFLAACSLTRPLLLFTMPKTQPFRATIVIFDSSAISSLAIVLILFGYRRLLQILRRSSLLNASLLILTVVAIIHVLILKNYGLEQFSASMMWVSIPILAMMYADVFKKVLPTWLVILWCVNAAHLCKQISLGIVPSGLPGNRNWTANFIVVSTPFVVFGWSRLLLTLKTPIVQERIWRWLPVALALVLLIYGDSRGAWLALIAGGGLFLFLSLNAKWKKVALGSVLVAALVAGAMFAWRGTDFAGKIISEDVRLSLWRSTLRLISDKPWLGTGVCRFESDFAPYRTVEYFLCKHAAVRTNHPHNHFLFFCASFGIPAFIAWFLLCVFPIVDWLCKFGRERDRVFTALCFAYVVILLHGMFDLILYEWPTNLIGLIILGVLWNRSWPRVEEATAVNPTTLVFFRRRGIELSLGTDVVVFAVAVVMSFYVVMTARRNFLASKDLRTAMIYTEVFKDHNRAARFFLRSITRRKDPLAIYRAAVRAYTRLRNPALAIRYFNMLTDRTPVDNYAHNQGFSGVSLLADGRLEEALERLRAETVNFPLLTGAWFNLHQVQKRLGLEEQAARSLDNVMLTLDLKHLDESHLGILLRNPEYDMDPSEIPQDLLKSDSQGKRELEFHR